MQKTNFIITTYKAIWNLRMIKRIVWLGLTIAILTTAQADWPQFRGPLGTGLIPHGANLPTEWSESENIDWKIALPGRAWSSPVVS
jgi:hypothetical protein